MLVSFTPPRCGTAQTSAGAEGELGFVPFFLFSCNNNNLL